MQTKNPKPPGHHKFEYSRAWRLRAALALYVCVLPALAQTGPPPPQANSDIAQTLRRQQEREQAERQRLEPNPQLREPAAGPAPFVKLPSGELPCFTLEQIELAGSDQEPWRWLLQALGGEDAQDPPLGQCLGAQGVEIVLKRAQQALVAQGYVTSRVLASAQDLSSGKLLLTIVPGRLRAIRFVAPPSQPDGQLPQEPPWALRNALPVQPGDILNLRAIEQALENFKRVPTAEADIQIVPAEDSAAQPDHSDLQIAYKQGFPLRLAWSVDDSGAKATGKYQSALSLSYDNFLRLNDLLYLTLSQDMGGGAAGRSAQGTRGNTVGYSLPLGDWMLGATVSNSRYFQSVAGASQNYVYSGTSSNAEVKFSRLLHRDARGKTTLSLKAFQRRSSNFIDDTEVQVQKRSVGGWELGAAHRQSLGPATLDANLAYKRGTGAFGALAAPEEAFGEGTSRLSVLSSDIQLSLPFKAAGQNWRYSANLRAQVNGTALTPQDRFAIGGRYTVRGFDGESSLSAERGWLIRNEVSATVGATGQELYAGLDHGKVAGPSSDSLVGKSLTGAVIGWRGGLQKFQYDCFLGAPVRKPSHFRSASSTVGCSLNIAF